LVPRRRGRAETGRARGRPAGRRRRAQPALLRPPPGARHRTAPDPIRAHRPRRIGRLQLRRHQIRGKSMRTRILSLAAVVVLVAGIAACSTKKDSNSGGTTNTAPIVVGSTLSLTGAFAATGAIHKLAGEEFVERLNAAGGVLGRKVQWKV